jgi:tRNA(adenine34) deaminase
MLSSSMGVPRIRRREAGKRLRTAFSNLGLDLERMATLIAFTARSMRTDTPTAVRRFDCGYENGSTAAARIECGEAGERSQRPCRGARDSQGNKRLKQISLAGYTLYTTCEPCPMCMSTALWAGLDRVVYGATIEDANRHCNQIQIPATEVAARSDMHCVVDGPLMRDECYALFTHPHMLRAFRLWQTRKRS